MDSYRLSTGAGVLDKLLEGGYESDIITTIYGPGGSGKTNLCLLAALACVKEGKKVIFIDTEGNFSLARLQQLTDDATNALDMIMLMKVTDFEQQSDILVRLEKLITKDVGLVIIDSIATLYRLERDDNPDEVTEINRVLGKQLYSISKICRTKNVPVIVTNQVYVSFEDDTIRMVGGKLLKYSSKCLIELEKYKAGKRRAILRKHRSMPEDKDAVFEIYQNGIREASA